MVDHTAWNKETPLSIWHSWTEFYRRRPMRAMWPQVRSECSPGVKRRRRDKKRSRRQHEGPELQPPRRSYAITTNKLARSVKPTQGLLTECPLSNSWQVVVRCQNQAEATKRSDASSARSRSVTRRRYSMLCLAMSTKPSLSVSTARSPCPARIRLWSPTLRRY